MTRDAAPITTAVIYARVSHDPKHVGRSVDSQVDECRSWADREGWNITAVVEDVDRSASRHAKRSREGWAEVVELIEAGDIDVLLTWEASRAQRDLAAYVELRELCERTGTRWGYSGQVYDLSDRSDRQRSGIDALMAEEESERISERTKRGQRQAVNAGKPHGRLLYGYRRVYDERNGEMLRQEPDPDTAPVVVEIADRFLSGESLRAIAADLNDRQVPNSVQSLRENGHPTFTTAWTGGRLQRLLSNAGYNGRRVHQGEIVGDAVWPALLDDDTFARVTAKLSDPSRRSTRSRSGANLLTGIARCGECGGPMRIGKDQGRRVYNCVAGFHVTRCADTLDAYATALVLERLARVDLKDLDDDTPDDALAARTEVEALRHRLDEAATAYADGELSAAMLARVEGELVTKIDDAQRRARFTGLPSTVADVADDAAVWDTLTVEQRREVVRSLVSVRVDRVAVRGRSAFDADAVSIEWLR